MAFDLITITDNTPIRGSQGRQLVANDQFLNDALADLQDITPRIRRVTLGQAAGAGGVFAWQNPEAGVIMVYLITMRIETPQSAQTIDIGRGGTAATASDTMIDGLSLATAGDFDSIKNKGTNGALSKIVSLAGTGESWITGTASGTPASLSGYVYIHYHLL